MWFLTFCFSHPQPGPMEPKPLPVSALLPSQGGQQEGQAEGLRTGRPRREGLRDGELGNVKESTGQGILSTGAESRTAWGLVRVRTLFPVSPIPSK